MYPLDVNGDINSNSIYRINGTPVLSPTGASVNTINTTDSLIINSNNPNCFLQFKSTAQPTNTLFGLVGGNIILRLPTDTAKFAIQDKNSYDLVWVDDFGKLYFTGGMHIYTGRIKCNGYISIFAGNSDYYFNSDGNAYCDGNGTRGVPKNIKPIFMIYRILLIIL